MYKMNYDRAVLALWDEKLKEDLHENFYDLIPMTLYLTKNPRAAVAEYGEKIIRGETPLAIISRFILEIEDPDPRELSKFMVKYHKLLMDRILRIIDKEELEVQIKRRRLLGE